MAHQSRPNGARPNSAGVRKKGRPLLKGFIIFVVLVLILAALAPRIASPIVKGQLTRSLGDGSELEAASVRLRWFSPTRVEGLVLTRPDGVKTLDLDIVSTASVFGLLTDWMNLGEITISGEATAPSSLASGDDGADEPGSDEPIMLPEGLRAVVKIDSVRVRVESAQQGVASPTATINGTASIDGSEPIVIDLDATGARGAIDLGSASIDATLSSLISEVGVLTPSRLDADVKVRAAGLDTSLLAPLLGAEADPEALLGRTVDASIDYAGTMKSGRGSLALTSEHVTADGAFELADNVLRTTQPLRARADASAISRGHASVGRALEEAGITLRQAPDATLTVPRLSVALPGGSGSGSSAPAADLRTLALEATLELGAAAFDVRPPGEEGPARKFASRAGTVRVAFDGSAETANLNADLAASVDGSNDAAATARLVFTDLLDDAGGLRIDALAWPAGSAELRGLPTALAQPFLAKTPVVLSRDVGPLLDLTLGREQGAGESVVVRASASNVQLNAQLERSGETISVRPGATLTLSELGPLVERALAPKEAGAEPPLSVDPGPLRVQIDRLVFDNAARAAGGTLATWLALDASATLEATTVQTGETPAVSLAPVQVIASVAPDASRAEVNIRGATVDGEPGLASATIRAGLTNLLSGGKTVPVRVEVAQLAPSFVGALPDGAGAQPVLAALGDRLDINITPTITLGDRLDLAGPIEVTGDRGSLTGEVALDDRVRGTVALDVRDASAIAGALGTAPEQAQLLTGQASARAEVDLARPAAGTPASGTAKLSANARGLTLTGDAEIKDQRGAFDLAATLSDPDTIAALLGMEPDAVRTALGDSIEIRGEGSMAFKDGYTPGDSGKATLRADARGLTASADANLTADALTAVARLKADDARVLDRVAGALAKLPEGVVSEAVGGELDARLDASLGRTDDGGIDTQRVSGKASVTSRRLQTAQPFAFERTPSRLRLTQPGELRWTVTPGLVAALVPADETGARPVTLISQTELRLRATRLDLPTGEGARPDAAVELVSGDIPVRLASQLERTYTGLRVTLEPPPGGAPGAIQLTATMREGEREALSARLVGERLGESFTATGQGAVRPALTGTLSLDAFDTAIIDAFAGAGGNVAQFLGASVSASADLNKFPAEGGTVRLSTTSPNADLTYSGIVRDDALVATGKPRTVVRHIDSEFGFKVAKFLPIAGTIVKDLEKHQPAYVETDTFVVPLDGNRDRLDIAARVDIGTGQLQFEQRFLKLIDKRIVERGRSVGDSFEPFTVRMKDGVFRTEGLVFPVGEFEIPASIEKNYPANRETQRVSLPAGAVAAEALRGQGVAADIISAVANIEVKSSGPIDADDSKLDVKVNVDEKKLIKEGIGEGLRNLLNRGKDAGESGGGGG